MLHDVVNNQLMVLGGELELLAGPSREAQRSLYDCRKAVQRISLALEALSEESLRHWKSKYASSMDEQGRLKL
jgi:hypothetical protein